MELMKILSFLLFSSLILAVHSAVFLEVQHPKSGHEGQCYDNEEDAYYNKGEEMKWKYKFCGRKFCAGSYGKDSTYVEIQTCGAYAARPECQMEADLSLPYPDCCPRFVCPTRKT